MSDGDLSPKAAELVTGMVTNDVSSLLPGEGQYAAALTAKGKIVADLRIFAAAIAALFLIGSIAAYVPARRTGRIDPSAALRIE